MSTSTEMDETVRFCNLSGDWPLPGQDDAVQECKAVAYGPARSAFICTCNHATVAGRPALEGVHIAHGLGDVPLAVWRDGGRYLFLRDEPEKTGLSLWPAGVE